MTRKTKWGILGTGRISRTFAEALAVIPEAELVAVGSRAQGSAADFARKYNVARAYESYEALARDPAVEAVYIGTPHNLHCENAILCPEAEDRVLDADRQRT